MDRDRLLSLLATTVEHPDPKVLPAARTHIRGKVRDIWELDDRLLIVASDRVSAFDRVLTTIPAKGEVLNRISCFWFDQTRDIIPNHLLACPTVRSMIVRKAEVLPIEVVVRGYLTGSAYRDYSKTGRVSGIELPPGMSEFQPFPEPLLTPSTKESEGHDRPISREEILKEGIVPEELWVKIENAAMALFRRGTDLVARNGLILVDTKYEFGLAGEELLLIDEVHTPDSSRYWYATDYQERLARGERPRQLDKEYLRRWLMEQGFMGDGEPPLIPDEVRVETAARYVEAFEQITGQSFEPGSLRWAEEAEALRNAMDRR